jgi:hypothetical protein
MSKLREGFARFLIICAPLLALPLAMAIGAVLLRVDISNHLTWRSGIAVCIAAIVATIWLARRSLQNPESFALTAIDVICIGTRRRTQAVINALLAPSNSD